MTKATLEDDKLKKFFKLCLRAFLVAVIVILIALIVIVFSSSNLSKKSNKTFLTYIVITESMIPTINVNDAVVVKKVDNDKINIGDIITFSTDNRYGQNFTVTHRIIGKQRVNGDNYIFRTKGDNNILEDSSLVSLENIYGKVVLKIPKIGYIKSFISSPIGFILAIIIPIVVLVIYEVMRIKKLYGERENELI